MVSAFARWKRSAIFALVATAIFIVASGLGWIFARSRYASTQADVRALISQLGGHYYYDYQLSESDDSQLADDDNIHSRPHWLTGLLGKDFVHDLFYISFARFRELRQDGAVAAERTEVGDEQLVEILKLERLRWLALPGTAVTDEGVKALARLPRLEKVWLSQTRITDRSLKLLSRFPHLIHLSIEATPTTDIGVRHIANLKQLEVLSVGSPHITPEGLAPLARLASLKELHADRLTIDASFLRGVAQHNRLQVLSLRHTSVTDNAVNALVSLDSLTRLLLDGTNISDAALINANWPNLLEFSARGTRLTDAGLQFLVGCNKLKLLKLEGTQCTLSGIKQLLVDKQSRTWQSALGLVFKTKVNDRQELISLDTSGFRLRDQDVPHLAAFSELHWLVMPGSELTDAGVQELAAGKLDALTLLNLNGSNITDAGLHQLSKLKSLRNLHLAGTQVSPSAVSEIAQTFPALRVYTSEITKSSQ